MKLTGKQVEQIHEALLSGYDLATLRMMVRMKLDLDLATIAGGNNNSAVVFNLIEWAEKTGKVPQLIAGAHQYNPDNTLLTALAQQASTWVEAILPASQQEAQAWRQPATSVQPAPAEVTLASSSPQQAQPAPPPSTELPNWQKAGIELVKIPAGKFLYGDDKKPVYLDEFWIGRTPVTDRQYQVFVDATGHAPPEHWSGKRVHPAKLNHPVVFVSWDDAQAFCEWAGLFLPTEQQWEKAARGTDGRKYPWGNESPTADLCNFNKHVGDTTLVGRYSPQGDSPYGIVDMAGNVWEWCEEKDVARRRVVQPSMSLSAARTGFTSILMTGTAMWVSGYVPRLLKSLASGAAGALWSLVWPSAR